MVDSRTPQHPLEEDGEEYHSESDEDFNPGVDAAEAEETEESSAEEIAPSTKPTKTRNGKRKSVAIAELDSGDEETIQERRKAKKRRASVDESAGGEEMLVSEDEDGTGGFIKTRSQRRTEGREKRPLARTDGATVDVEALWEQMIAKPLVQPTMPPPAPATTPKIPTGLAEPDDLPATQATSGINTDEEMITIKRTYDFAGQRITEERQVPKASEEARVYLASLESEKPPSTEVDGAAKEEPRKSGDISLRRPLKRPSRFDPNPSGFVKALPVELQLSWFRKGMPSAASGSEAQPSTVHALKKAPKLTTVEKSRYDWAGYVDKEGIADELAEYGKSKESYLDRVGFLNRAEARREEDIREARVGGA